MSKYRILRRAKRGGALCPTCERWQLNVAPGWVVLLHMLAPGEFSFSNVGFMPTPPVIPQPKDDNQ